MNEKIRTARKAGRVMRYHTSEVLRTEDVAQHTFNMLNLLMILTEGAVSIGLMKAALLHDQGEYVTGDIPSPVKKSLGHYHELASMEEAAVNFIHKQGSPKLTKWEHTLLKIADNMDGLIKCTEEVKLGNRDLVPVGRVYTNYLFKQLEEVGGGNISHFISSAIRDFEDAAK